MRPRAWRRLKRSALRFLAFQKYFPKRVSPFEVMTLVVDLQHYKLAHPLLYLKNKNSSLGSQESLFSSLATWMIRLLLFGNNRATCIQNDTKSQQTTVQTKTASPKNFFKVLQLKANCNRNKTEEIELLNKNTSGRHNNTKAKLN